VFCGATDQKLSKEHLWPRWLRNHVDGGVGPPQEHYRAQRTADGSVVLDERWTAIPFERQVKGPCRPCNNGWMSDVENSVMPSLIPMLANEETTLDCRAQDSLARWATLRMMIAQLGHPAERRRAIPPERYARFYSGLAMPPGAQVWLGRHDGSGGWPTEYQYRELFVSALGQPEPSSPNAYVAAFSIGYAAFVYWGSELSSLFLHDLGRLAPYVVPVWPVRPPSVRWPPQELVRKDGLASIVEFLSNPVPRL